MLNKFGRMHLFPFPFLRHDSKYKVIRFHIKLTFNMPSTCLSLFNNIKARLQARFVLGLAMTSLITPVQAAQGTGFSRGDVMLGVSLIALFSFSLFAGSAYFKLRNKRAKEAKAQKLLAQSDAARLEQTLALLEGQNFVHIIYAGQQYATQILGNVEKIIPHVRKSDVLRFEQWLSVQDLNVLMAQLARLKASGIAFQLDLTTQRDFKITAHGFTVAGNAVLRFQALEVAQENAVEQAGSLYQEHEKALAQLEHFLDHLPHPFWLRDEVGRLRYVNRAFSRAVEQPDNAKAILNNVDFFDQAARQEIMQKRGVRQAFLGAVKASAGGARRTYDVLDTPFEWGSAGFAIDITATDMLHKQRKAEIMGQRQFFDQLTSGIAIFGEDERLIFFNEAYCKMWGLSAQYLDERPSESEILDKLKLASKLPETPNYRTWKQKHLETYQARGLEPREEVWYLPSQATLRVVQNPNPEGGITYLFEDLTEKMDLQSRFHTLNRLQLETLDTLNEAVCVFATNGTLTLSNAAFAQLWHLESDYLRSNPHIDKIIAHLSEFVQHYAIWWLAFRSNGM
jgi:PAS domain-containing protein